MRKINTRLVIPIGLFVFVMIAVGLSSALQHGKAFAQASAKTCNVLMIMDRSGSVGDNPKNYAGISNGVQSFFSPAGVLRQDVAAQQAQGDQLTINFGFWSFSASGDISPGTTEAYDAPYMTFQDIASPTSLRNFQAAYGQLKEQGGTDYEQGFGYNGWVFDNTAANPNGDQTANPDPNIRNMMNHKIDVLAFMTDGLPSTPTQLTGNGDDNNPGAIKAAKAAYNALVAQNPGLNNYTTAFMFGSSLDSSAMDFILNDYRKPADTEASAPLAINAATGKGKGYNNGRSVPNIVYITDYQRDISGSIANNVTSLCNKKAGVSLGDQYSLNPTVTSNETVSGGTASATFSYNVNSSLPSGSKTNSSSDWRIEKLIVPPGQSASGIQFGQPGTCGASAHVSYCDGIPDCTGLSPLIGGNGGGRQCTEKFASGNNGFPHGDTSLDQYASNATSATIDSSMAIGTKICFVLIVAKPTRDDIPANRASRAACLTVGKKPSVQVTGGDLRVGRYFITDTIASDPAARPAPSQVSTSVTTKSKDGVITSYGSWVEYAAIAPGAITGLASGSGLAGGYTSPTGGGQQSNWSKLTFGNAQNTYGLFTAANNGQGVIPDYAAAILAASNPVRDLTSTDNVTLTSGSNASGIYNKQSGDLKVNKSSLGKNEAVILNVPNGTVTISGDINYDDGPYSAIGEIPQLIIIAKTINIDSGVGNIDAWLIAGSASDGTVATCDDGQTLTVNVCNQRLTINGPVIAHHLSLRRTAGSGDDADSTNPAELINLPGTTYLWAQGAGQSSVRAQTTFTTEQPPYF
ncbi:MAG: hypothetical protein JWO07_773 [Candidatus Saccharibacteria bacterium]|nr:hypothetical protein [Candidatus Saccharibacteria bacterium]